MCKNNVQTGCTGYVHIKLSLVNVIKIKIKSVIKNKIVCCVCVYIYIYIYIYIDCTIITMLLLFYPAVYFYFSQLKEIIIFLSIIHT